MSKKTLTIRIDEDLWKRLQLAADYEGRTASNQVRILIRKHVEQYERKQEKARRRSLQCRSAEEATPAEAHEP